MQVSLEDRTKDETFSEIFGSLGLAEGRALTLRNTAWITFYGAIAFWKPSCVRAFEHEGRIVVRRRNAFIYLLYLESTAVHY